MRLLKTTLCALALTFASTASADPIGTGNYQLGNHPDGSAANPLYGLRLDRLLFGSQDPHKIYTFDFEADDGVKVANVRMTWDGSTLRIFGDAFGGRDLGDEYDPNYSDWWTIEFSYTDFTQCGNNLCSSSGGGSISSGLGAFDLTSQHSGSHGYGFQIADGRYRGYDGISGWGWVNHCAADNSSSDYPGADCSVHQYSSDWLFTAHKVSEPSTLALLGLGLVAMGLRRRRKVIAS